MIIRLAERNLRTKFGTFREILYYDGQAESMALVMGDVTDQTDVLCRIHSLCVGAHFFNSVECECREEMARAQKLIEKAGRGVVVWLDQEAKGNGHLALLASTKFKEKGVAQADAYRMAGFSSDNRSYRAAAEILTDLQVKSIILLANSPAKAVELRKYEVEVTAVQELQD